MSNNLDKVRGITQLPLFPLPVVLFPGVPMPLHIFEARYREMLTDICIGSKLFGLSYFDPSKSSLEVPPAGHIGCVAEVTEVQILPDGRSNIMTVGVIRYVVNGYRETGDLYLVVEVSFFEDDAEDPDLLSGIASEVSDLFMRIAQAVSILGDSRVSLPALPETDPEQLSFFVAAAMDLDAEVKCELLEMRSTSERLTRLQELMENVVSNYEERARVHKIAKGNGHSGRKIEIE
jgi:Lon protease-like protein